MCGFGTVYGDLDSWLWFYSARVTVGIITGIGSLDAGTILHRQGGIVEGLTTAVTIWAVAGIGLVVCAGIHIISAVATVINSGILFPPYIPR
jgi:putative Mg2+ transporter-C (MgtC) family protein